LLVPCIEEAQSVLHWGIEMANVWRVYEGKEPTLGDPWLTLPASDAIHFFRLKREDAIEPRKAPPVGPRFGDTTRDLRHAGYKHIVVEIEPDEGRKEKWKAGYYPSSVRVSQAPTVLLQQALASALGRENVRRVELKSGADSQGREALRVIVAVPRHAADKLTGKRVADGLLRLRQRLVELGDDREPLVQFIGEDEAH
jgi:hypothetical protein